MRRYRSAYTPRSLRRQEAKNKKRLIITLIFGAILIFSILFWGLPVLIGGLSFFNRLKPISQEKEVINSSLAPPTLNIPFEATSSATIKISGFTVANSKVQIYLDDKLVTTPQADQDGNFQTTTIELSLGSNNIYGKTIDEKERESLPSKTITIFYNSEKPKLEVSEPEDGKEIKGGDKKVRVAGQVDDPETDVTINGARVIVTSEGKFSTEININEGENDIQIIASNSVGISTTLSKKVKYSP